MAIVVFKARGERVTFTLNEINVLLLAAMTKSGCNTDAELARKIGVSRMAVHRWRTRQGRPSPQHLDLILKIGGFGEGSAKKS